MHSFHRSRGRILFEVFCALGISASCVAAWMQTYAPAMLAVAGFAGLYGLVHAFELLWRSPAIAAAAETSAPVTDDRGDLLVYLEDDEPELLLDSEPEVGEIADERGPNLAAPMQEREPEVVEPVLPLEPAPVSIQEPKPEVAEPVEIVEPAEPVHEEPEYAPVAPLFEPQPFVRNQRAAFGRKAG